MSYIQKCPFCGRRFALLDRFNEHYLECARKEQELLDREWDKKTKDSKDNKA